jgi:hypothetical protein
MKTPINHPFLKSALLATLLGTSAAMAGEPEKPAAAPEPESKFSGVLNLDYNTHFVSYGFDVWGDGNDLDAGTFNPSLELTWKLPNNFSAILGTWWDVNGNANSGIGGNIQEIDVWGGIGYSVGDLSITTLYQAWNYASDTEEILDVKFAYSCLLSPSLTIHNRLQEGASGGQDGTILVLGLSHSVEAGPVAISFPFNLAYFLEDDFHPASTDSGFGYGSLGVTATLPLTCLGTEYGEWNLHGGVIYYITSDDVVANAVDDDFFTANIGIGCAF